VPALPTARSSRPSLTSLRFGTRICLRRCQATGRNSAHCFLACRMFIPNALSWSQADVLHHERDSQAHLAGKAQTGDDDVGASCRERTNVRRVRRRPRRGCNQGMRWAPDERNPAPRVCQRRRD
jgi:hypothetical protein